MGLEQAAQQQQKELVSIIIAGTDTVELVLIDFTVVRPSK